MVYQVRPYCLATILGSVLMPSLVLAQATLSMKAVRVNPVCVGGINAGEHCTSDFICDSKSCGGAITPTNILRAQPGDVIVVEAFLSNFSPNGESLRAWQMKFDAVRMITSGCESAIPLGSETCPDEVQPLDSGCAGLYLPCCIPFEILRKGFFLDSFHPEYVFKDLVGFVGVDLVNYRMGATLLSSDPIVTYDGTPKYVGTIVAVISANACGTSTVAFDESQSNLALVEFPNIATNISIFENLTIEVATPCIPEIIDVQPPPCTLMSTFSDTNLILTLAQAPEIDLARCKPNIRHVAEAPYDEPQLLGFDVLKISDIITRGNRVIISMNPNVLPPFSWSCLSGFGLTDEWCQGLSPGDINRDLTANEMDVLIVMECLRSPEFCETDVCDFNLTGACTPLDMLDLIDVLNTPNPPFMNETIVPCPSP